MRRLLWIANSYYVPNLFLRFEHLRKFPLAAARQEDMLMGMLTETRIVQLRDGQLMEEELLCSVKLSILGTYFGLSQSDFKAL